MSADLFAEFSNPPDSAPSQPPSNPAGRAGQPQAHAQASWPQDPFNFGNGSDAARPQQPQSAQQWSNFQGGAQSSSLSGWNQASEPAQSFAPPPQQLDEDDGWGDFEVADTVNINSVAPPAAATPSISQPSGPSGPSWTSHDSFRPIQDGPSPTSFQLPAQQRTTSSLVGTEPAASSQPTQFDMSWDQPEARSKIPMRSTVSKDPNVLFDAEDFELQGGEDLDIDGDFDDGDDFGDFEAVVPSQETSIPATRTQQAAPQGPVQPQYKPSVSTVSASLDLLGLDDTIDSSPPVEKYTDSLSRPPNAALSFGTVNDSQSKPQPTSRQTQDTIQDLWSETAAATFSQSKHEPPASSRSIKPSAKKQSSASKKPAPVKEMTNDDDWVAWDDPPSTTSTKKPVKQSQEAAEDWGWGADDSVDSPREKASDTVPPPMNVPPPSVLLSAFPDLFASGNALFKPVAGQSTSIKNQVSSNPKTVQFLEGYVLLATTAARVIAGRKHRWHRDKILAKSMSISAAGSKGMKLAGVDKTQSAREDREAADVVAAWRENIGRLRSAVAAANNTGKANLKVPELTESPQVQTAKQVPTAPKPCIICGLKREERVAKVDYEVEDSFGEWWVDHWGHRACKNFWIEHEQRLRQR